MTDEKRCPWCGHDPEVQTSLIQQGRAVTEIRVEMHEAAGRAGTWDEIAASCRTMLTRNPPLNGQAAAVMQGILNAAQDHARELHVKVDQALRRIESIGATDA